MNFVVSGNMNICRWGAAVGALGPFLYICGGSDDASRLETVERFDPFTNVWVPSVPMSSSRNGVGVTAGSGRIYAIGNTIVFVTSTVTVCTIGTLLLKLFTRGHTHDL